MRPGATRIELGASWRRRGRERNGFYERKKAIRTKPKQSSFDR